MSRLPEKKFIDVAIGGNFVFGQIPANAPVLLNPCAQGVDANQHIGRTTKMTSLYWMFQGSLGVGTTGASSARMLIVYDKEAEGAAPTVAVGLQTDIMALDAIYGMNNLNNRDRFVTLVDEIVESFGTAGPQAFFRKGYRKVSLPCVFNGSAAATIAAINTGSVYVVVWQNGTLLAANSPYVVQTRIRFEDA